MPSSEYSTDVRISIDGLWKVVSDINKWAPLMPGYIEHEIMNERQFKWAFKGDFGFITKTVKLKIDITRQDKPKVMFDLTGISDELTGGGYFEAEPIDAANTRLTGFLDITGQGATSFMINSILKSSVPETVKELTAAVAAKAEHEAVAS